MIKYPVIVVAERCCIKIEESIYYPGFIVRDADNQLLLSLESEEDANTIANALNAMNEFPTCAVGSSWINEVLVPWFKKFFPVYKIHHTKERDCLCEECADT